ncbi:hypothetical protein QBC35DRAFT_509142 [Podospora australis]|uniref:Uncharacterized protein n=1 Tax=Podospora australis TaxID=1536484 RepID=A0AAN6WJB2_9PEZI|nr:hypothetical protein QBC35DRAFT_509142 [Podospora australis]
MAQGSLATNNFLGPSPTAIRPQFPRNHHVLRRDNKKRRGECAPRPPHQRIRTAIRLFSVLFLLLAMGEKRPQTEMEDSVSPDEDRLRAVYRDSYRVWESLRANAQTNHSQIAIRSVESLDTAFPQLPTFPIPSKPAESSTDIYSHRISAQTHWDAGKGNNSCKEEVDLDRLRQPLALSISVNSPVSITFTNETSLSGWFGRNENDHLSILILAWAYILSARWQEIVRGASPMAYGIDGEKATLGKPYSGDAIQVDIGNASMEATRWWAAVLGPGRGWSATIPDPKRKRVCHSPWAIRLPKNPVFSLCGQTYDLVETWDNIPAATFGQAMEYLSDYVNRHNLAHQSRAALSAALYIAVSESEHGLGSRLKLPLPRPSSSPSAPTRTRATLVPVHQLDKLMLLSCNDRGLFAVLHSTFFDPDIPCNLISPYLQGAFAVLDAAAISEEPADAVEEGLPLAGPSPRHIQTATLILRQPEAGFLWIGAMLVGGLGDQIFRDGRHGNYTVDMASAAWTGTIQSFLQLPVSPSQSHPDAERVLKADEARLLFLLGGDEKEVYDHYQRLPSNCPWKPFGSTLWDDTEVSVRLHRTCSGGHQLRYRGIAWDDEPFQPASSPSSCMLPQHNNTKGGGKSMAEIEVNYHAFEPDDNDASASATFRIFMWLRQGSFTAEEQVIRRHEWVCEPFDDEEADGAESAFESETEYEARVKKFMRSDGRKRPRIAKWVGRARSVVSN